MKHIAEEVYGFKVIYGDTDSIFVTNAKSERAINKFLAECSIVLEDMEIELLSIYKKLLLIEKKLQDLLYSSYQQFHQRFLQKGHLFHLFQILFLFPHRFHHPRE